jgi:thiol-disulfide isomerase/thioredoxin
MRSKYYYGRMFRLSISVAIFAAAITSNLGHAETQAGPAKDGAANRTILMFGASWCAPCIAELRDIATLASGASPDRIVVAWTDGGIRRYKLALPGNVEIASGVDVQQMARRYASGTSGLPYSVMIDDRGGKCAEWKAGLTTEAIRQMRSTCTISVH